MGDTLTVAREREGYTLADRGTWLALSQDLGGLALLHAGDRSMLNIYHVMEVNEEKHDAVNGEAADAFVEFMLDPETQAFIGEFKVAEYGESLFVPDAGKSVDQLGN